MVIHGYQTEIEKRWKSGAQNKIYQSISEKNTVVTELDSAVVRIYLKVVL